MRLSSTGVKETLEKPDLGVSTLPEGLSSMRVGVTGGERVSRRCSLAVRTDTRRGVEGAMTTRRSLDRSWMDIVGGFRSL